MITVLNQGTRTIVWDKIRNLISKDLDYYKFFIGSAKNISQLGKEMGLEKVEFISESDNKINGYFSYIYDSSTRTAKEFELLSLEKNSKNITLLKDFAKVIRCIYDSPDYERLEVEIIKGAPSSCILESLIRANSFRVVGEKRKAIRLNDNKLYDIVIYEHLKEE